MAIKPTIYKQRIALSDLERNLYDTLNLTVALHPSETNQRLMARILAYVLNVQSRISFTKGLSDVDVPDIWVQEMDETLSLWIDVGEPAVERVKKATYKAGLVKVYSFNSKSDVWWQQSQNKFAQLDAPYYRFNAASIDTYAQLLERTMDYSITITGDSAYIATNLGECEVTWEALHEK